MADITFQCPHCSQKISGDDSFCGKEIQCPTCNQPFITPERPKESPTPIRRTNDRNIPARPKLSLVDRFLVFNFRFGKVFAALMSAVFLLGFVASFAVFLLQSRTSLRVPTFEDLQGESKHSSADAEDTSQLDDSRLVEKQFGDKLADIVKVYGIGTKSYKVLIGDVVDTPKEFRSDYVSGLENALKKAKQPSDKNPSGTLDPAETASGFRYAFKAAVVKSKFNKEASSVTRWIALAAAGGCCMATFLMLMIPALLRIEENTRKDVA